jgi:2-oxoglutarate ferredoxin oxidoreductase subunit gamma
MPMRTEIRLAGFGGQGIVLAGAILGEAAIMADMEAVQTQSYGPESRGGAARSEVVISDQAVDYPRVACPDVLVVLSTAAMQKYGEDLGEHTKVVVDDDLVQMEVPGAERVPFSMTADDLGRRIVANIVMLGFITNRFKLVPKKAMEASILKRIPKGTEELNMGAFRAGWDLADGKKPKIPKKKAKDGKKVKKGSEEKGKKAKDGKKVKKGSKGTKKGGGK